MQAQIKDRKENRPMQINMATAPTPFAAWAPYAALLDSETFADLADFMGSKVIFDGSKKGGVE